MGLLHTWMISSCLAVWQRCSSLFIMDDFILFVYNFSISGSYQVPCFFYLPPLIFHQGCCLCLLCTTTFCCFATTLGITLGGVTRRLVSPLVVEVQKFRPDVLGKSWDRLFNDKSRNSTWDFWLICNNIDTYIWYVYISGLQTIVKK